MNPFISVIIPNFNHGVFLNERINSVLNQTYENFEIIILDDASTDHSREIIEGYRVESKISKIIYNKNNSGNVFIQWEKGISTAKGEWIWIAESDDIADINFLKSMVFEINKHPNVVLGFCCSKVIDEFGNLSEYMNLRFMPDFSKEPFNKNHLIEGDKFIKDHLLQYNTIPNASAVLFKKEYFNKVKSFSLCGDWYLWINVLNHNKGFYINEILNSFRRHNNTVRNSTSDAVFFQEYIKIVRIIKNNINLRTWDVLKIEDVVLFRYKKIKNLKTKLFFLILIVKIKVTHKIHGIIYNHS